MSSKRSHEGYLMIDNRASDPLTEEELRKSGLPVAAAGSKFYEGATITCSHCQKQLMVNRLRTRERGYCPKCDHYVCDKCNVVRLATGECRTFKQLIDEIQEANFQHENKIIL